MDSDKLILIAAEACDDIKALNTKLIKNWTLAS